MIEVKFEEHIVINIQLIDEDAKAFIQEITQAIQIIKADHNKLKFSVMEKIYQELTTK